MRVVYCFCGECIEGTSDADLFQRNCDHQNRAHPTQQTSDAQIWAVIKANAYEEPDIPDHEQTIREHHRSAGEPIEQRH